jgi:hypothetical protein
MESLDPEIEDDGFFGNPEIEDDGFFGNPEIEDDGFFGNPEGSYPFCFNFSKTQIHPSAGRRENCFDLAQLFSFLLMDRVVINRGRQSSARRENCLSCSIVFLSC